MSRLLRSLVMASLVGAMGCASARTENPQQVDAHHYLTGGVNALSEFTQIKLPPGATIGSQEEALLDYSLEQLRMAQREDNNLLSSLYLGMAHSIKAKTNRAQGETFEAHADSAISYLQPSLESLAREEQDMLPQWEEVIQEQRLSLADAYLMKKDFAHAAGTFLDARKHGSDDYRVINGLGFAAQQARIEDVESAYVRSFLAAKSGNIDLAREQALQVQGDESLSYESRQLDAMINLYASRKAQSSGQPLSQTLLEKTKDELEGLLVQEPDDAWATAMLAASQVSLSDFATAHSTLEQWLSRHYYEPEQLLTMGIHLHELGATAMRNQENGRVLQDVGKGYVLRAMALQPQNTSLQDYYEGFGDKE